MSTPCNFSVCRHHPHNSGDVHRDFRILLSTLVGGNRSITPGADYSRRSGGYRGCSPPIHPELIRNQSRCVVRPSYRACALVGQPCPAQVKLIFALNVSYKYSLTDAAVGRVLGVCSSSMKCAVRGSMCPVLMFVWETAVAQFCVLLEIAISLMLCSRRPQSPGPYVFQETVVSWL